MAAVRLTPNSMVPATSGEPDLERVRRIGSRRMSDSTSRELAVARNRRRAAKRDKLASELRRTLETNGAFKG